MPIKKKAEYANLLLKNFKKQVKTEINENYRTLEEFCFVNDISHSIISRWFSNNSPDIRASTIYRIAKGLGKTAEIKLK